MAPNGVLWYRIEKQAAGGARAGRESVRDFMANDKKKMVEAITAQEVDFAQWYTDICKKAELVEYSSVKGFVVLTLR